MPEILYQGNKDVFLVGVRADFDAVEDQALKGYNSIKSYSLVGSDPNGDALFTQISDMESKRSDTVNGTNVPAGASWRGKRGATLNCDESLGRH